MKSVWTAESLKPSASSANRIELPVRAVDGSVVPWPNAM